MAHNTPLFFGPFRLDPERKRVWRGEEQLGLRPMAVTVLQDLVERAGQVVTKEELLKRVWAGTYVSKTALKVCVREIREALGDTVVAPRYIETVGQQGYRFVGGGDTAEQPLGGEQSGPRGRVVGRQREAEQLRVCLEKALGGERQVVFLTGEAGIGKTTVVDCFLDSVRTAGQIRLGRGQCLEQYGAGEAYLPVLGSDRTAVSRAGRGTYCSSAEPGRPDVAGPDASVCKRD